MDISEALLTPSCERQALCNSSLFLIVFSALQYKPAGICFSITVQIRRSYAALNIAKRPIRVEISSHSPSAAKSLLQFLRTFPFTWSPTLYVCACAIDRGSQPSLLHLDLGHYFYAL